MRSPHTPSANDIAGAPAEAVLARRSRWRLAGPASALPLAWLLLLCAVVVAPAGAATVEGLYAATVAGDATEAGRAAAAEEALRQVAVRVTGRRAAANDPALAALYADARRYAQTFQPAGRGLVAVGFDAAAVDAALAAARQPLWGRERPVTLVLLVVDRPPQPRTLAGGPDSEDKRLVERAAAFRGLPLAWPGALDAASAQAAIDDVLGGRVERLRELGTRYGADRVLAARAAPAGAGWRLVSPAGVETGEGAPAEGLHALADGLAAQSAVGGAAGTIVLVAVEVAGLADLPAYVAAQAALQALPNVRDVRLEAAAGEVARFRLNFAGDAAALVRAAAGGRLVPDDAAPVVDGTARFRLRP